MSSSDDLDDLVSGAGVRTPVSTPRWFTTAWGDIRLVDRAAEPDLPSSLGTDEAVPHDAVPHDDVAKLTLLSAAEPLQPDAPQSGVVPSPHASQWSDAAAESCQLIELFPASRDLPAAKPRPARRRGWSVFQGVAIAVAALIVTVTLFEILGWLIAR